jgi:hypothetical protein
MPDWRTLGFQPEVADELARIMEAPDLADGGDERRGGHQAHAGDGHQPLDLCRGQRTLGDHALEDRDLGVEEVDLAQAPIDGLTLVAGQLELGQPCAAALAERVCHRRAALEVAHQHRVDLVLGTGALTHELRTAREAPAQRPRVVIRQPTAAQQAGGEQPRERARVVAVGLDLGLGDRAQLAPCGHDDPRDMPLQQTRDGQRVAGRLQRDLILRAKAVGQDLHPLRAAGHTTRRAHTPAFADRDLAEIQMHV